MWSCNVVPTIKTRAFCFLGGFGFNFPFSHHNQCFHLPLHLSDLPSYYRITRYSNDIDNLHYTYNAICQLRNKEHEKQFITETVGYFMLLSVICLKYGCLLFILEPMSTQTHTISFHPSNTSGDVLDPLITKVNGDQWSQNNTNDHKVQQSKQFDHYILWDNDKKTFNDKQT